MTPVNLTHDVVLVGGGHAHALLLKSWGMDPVPGARLTVINPGPTAPYTGMLPGHVAGHYPREALDIDLMRLARFAGARIILGSVDGIDPVARTVHVPGRPPLRYDVLAIDIGINSEMPEIAGFADHAVAAKPLSTFADRWAAWRGKAGQNPRVAMIGGGVGGVELAMAMAHALRHDGLVPDVTVLDRSRVLQHLGTKARRTLLETMATLGVTCREGVEVAEVTATGVALRDGGQIAADFVAGAAGARPWVWLEETGLPLTDGFIDVGPCLDVIGATGVFASGDCAHLTHAPRPKAGVFAVRAAPILLHNIRASVLGQPLRRFRPQSDYLKLISLGEKSALAEKFGIALSGGALWRLKDKIDRDFMDRLSDLPAMSGEAGDAPLCTGCGAKVGPGVLFDALAGLPSPDRADILSEPGDDAAILRTGTAKQVLTTDHLRAVTEDPWLLGRIAAIHALGDIWAMGAAPQAALVNLILPRMAEAMQAATLAELLDGAGTVLRDAGAALVGGHTTMGAEMTVGLTLTGLVDQPITLNGARPGDVLILTKPIGSGTILAGEMQGKASGEEVAATLDTMTERPPGIDELRAAHAMTDVTGFGLAGHLMNMLDASSVRAEISLDAIPVYPGAARLAAAGVRSTLYAANRASVEPGMTLPDDARIPLMFDPQTAGGLLAAVSPETAALYPDLPRIGRILAGPPAIRVIRGDEGASA